MSDHRTLLHGTALNVVGLGAGVVAAFGVQILLGRTLPVGGLGLVTVAVQVAFVAAAGSRFGMDMAAVREVAIAQGADAASHVRSLVDRAVGVAFAISVLVAVAIAAASPLLGDNQTTVALAAVSIPFAAVANTYLGATRGLKSMAPTLWVFWIGQPVAWIAVAGAAIALGGGTWAAVIAYDVSWIVAAVAARAMWRRRSAGMGDEPATRDELVQALRFGAPRAPSALLAQALFWADLWVLDAFASGNTLDTYAAVGRISQVILLFLTSLNLLFSPFAADLHARGHRTQLDALFKSATRWALTATAPVVIVLSIAAAQALQAFNPAFSDGATALRILLIGQLINVATGSVGFVLIMVGRTGVDLIDNILATVILVGMAIPLASSYGMNGVAVASAVSLAGVNMVRLLQVRHIVHIQPYTRSYLHLVVPAAACAAAALAAHQLLAGRSWWLVLFATGAAGFAAYIVLLPMSLPAGEREEVYRRTRRITKRPNVEDTSGGSV